VEAHFIHTVVLLMPSGPIRFPPTLTLQNYCATMAARREFRTDLPLIVIDLTR
jgi:hypothetical protein